MSIPKSKSCVLTESLDSKTGLIKSSLESLYFNTVDFVIGFNIFLGLGEDIGYNNSGYLSKDVTIGVIIGLDIFPIFGLESLEPLKSNFNVGTNSSSLYFYISKSNSDTDTDV